MSFAAFTGLFLTGCLDSSPKFKPGDCINAVDGALVFKLDQVDGEQLFGHRYLEGRKLAETGETLPSGRIYSKVPCPR